LLAAGLATFIALGCGGGNAKQDQVRREVRLAMTSGKASDCTLYYTRRFLVQVAGEPANQAIKDCRKDPTPFSKRVRISSLSVDGSEALVTVHGIGGQMGGSVLAVELIEANGSWRFDHLSSIQLNRPSFDAGLRQSLIRDGTSAERARCGVSRARTIITTQQWEQALVSGDESEVRAAYRHAFLSCLDPQQLRLKLVQAVVGGLQESGIPRSLRNCITLRIARLGNRRMIHLILAGRRLALGVGRAAALDCIEHPPVS
jgi:hypothetical protein